jgi:ergothioneine biosynthesis protein EgtC
VGDAATLATLFRFRVGPRGRLGARREERGDRSARIPASPIADARGARGIWRMCRFTLYLGPPIRLDSLLIEPSHSLILQSFRSAERDEPLNGDGFGVGWYAPGLASRPARFRSITPAWNNANLRSIAGVVSSPCVMAHVRAASAGMPVAEMNCHPFQRDRYLFMHNGHIGSFPKIRRALLGSLRDEAFHIIQGSTDSEHLFAVFIDELPAEGTDEPLALAACLNRAVWRVLALVDELEGGQPSYLNLAITDGDCAAACRFTNDPSREPESLYVIQGELYRPVAAGSAGRRHAERSTSFVVSSERLTEDPGWQPVPANHMIAIARDGTKSAFLMTRDGLIPA